MIIRLFFAFFLLICPSVYSATWQEEVQEIECQIEKLQKIKKGYESKALYHENQAERLQFIQQEMQTAKKHWIMAEENREIAKKIQKDIDQLEEKKQELLRKHG